MARDPITTSKSAKFADLGQIRKVFVFDHRVHPVPHWENRQLVCLFRIRNKQSFGMNAKTGAKFALIGQIFMGSDSEPMKLPSGWDALYLLARASMPQYTQTRARVRRPSKTNARALVCRGATCSGKAFVSQCAPGTPCGATSRQKSCNINKRLTSF